MNEKPRKIMNQTQQLTNTKNQTQLFPLFQMPKEEVGETEERISSISQNGFDA